MSAPIMNVFVYLVEKGKAFPTKRIGPIKVSPGTFVGKFNEMVQEEGKKMRGGEGMINLEAFARKDATKEAEATPPPFDEKDALCVTQKFGSGRLCANDENEIELYVAFQKAVIARAAKWSAANCEIEIIDDPPSFNPSTKYYPRCVTAIEDNWKDLADHDERSRPILTFIAEAGKGKTTAGVCDTFEAVKNIVGGDKSVSVIRVRLTGVIVPSDTDRERNSRNELAKRFLYEQVLSKVSTTDYVIVLIDECQHDVHLCHGLAWVTPRHVLVAFSGLDAGGEAEALPCEHRHLRPVPLVPVDFVNLHLPSLVSHMDRSGGCFRELMIRIDDNYYAFSVLKKALERKASETNDGIAKWVETATVAQWMEIENRVADAIGERSGVSFLGPARCRECCERIYDAVLCNDVVAASDAHGLASTVDKNVRINGASWRYICMKKNVQGIPANSFRVQPLEFEVLTQKCLTERISTIAKNLKRQNRFRMCPLSKILPGVMWKGISGDFQVDLSGWDDVTTTQLHDKLEGVVDDSVKVRFIGNATQFRPLAAPASCQNADHAEYGDIILLFHNLALILHVKQFTSASHSQAASRTLPWADVFTELEKAGFGEETEEERYPSQRKLTEYLRKKCTTAAFVLITNHELPTTTTRKEMLEVYDTNWGVADHKDFPSVMYPFHYLTNFLLDNHESSLIHELSFHDINNLTRQELLAELCNRGVTGCSKMTKAALQNKLRVLMRAQPLGNEEPTMPKDDAEARAHAAPTVGEKRAREE